MSTATTESLALARQRVALLVGRAVAAIVRDADVTTDGAVTLEPWRRTMLDEIHEVAAALEASLVDLECRLIQASAERRES